MRCGRLHATNPSHESANHRLRRPARPGQALLASKPAGIELIATSRTGGGEGGEALLPLNLADANACRAAVQQHQPDWLSNAGAYTAVDKAESEPELALAVIGGATRTFAEALLETVGRLLQVSTDFVFNGQQGSPYRPDQMRDPLGIYGATKAAGEEAVEEVLHWCDAGAASWFDVAVAVGELAQELGLLQQPAPVNPLTTAMYPLPAQRLPARLLQHPPGPSPTAGGGRMGITIKLDRSSSQFCRGCRVDVAGR